MPAPSKVPAHYLFSRKIISNQRRGKYSNKCRIINQFNWQKELYLTLDIKPYAWNLIIRVLQYRK